MEHCQGCASQLHFYVTCRLVISPQISCNRRKVPWLPILAAFAAHASTVVGTCSRHLRSTGTHSISRSGFYEDWKQYTPALSTVTAPLNISFFALHVEAT